MEDILAREKDILTKIVQGQVKILGKKALVEIEKLNSIKLDKDGKVVWFIDFEVAIKEIVNILRPLNPLAPATIFTILTFAKIKNPDLKIPNIFQKEI